MTNVASGLQTPLAFFVFNRPESTARVFAEIRRARPSQLLLVADGPRPSVASDPENCRVTQRLVEEGIDWPCMFLRQYSDANLGCRKRVASGLEWVFQQVDEAIILEDDCLPHPTFFGFCAELLARFRNEDRVMSISGDNFYRAGERSPFSYRFSDIPHIWGWATWRRAFRHYDPTMAAWPTFKQERGLEKLGFDPLMLEFWDRVLAETYLGRIDTWDYQWCFASFRRGGLHVLPRRNLVANIGYSASATHTSGGSMALSNLPIFPADSPSRHPPRLEPDRTADWATFRATVGRPLLRRARDKFERLLSPLARRAGG